jgi:hypothetical protein
MKQWTKKLISLTVVAVMLTAMLPMGIFTTSALNYSKSEFSIANLSDWNDVASCTENFAGKTVKLTADFDAGGANLTTLFSTFAGTFDGQGHTIKNFTATNALIAQSTSAGAVIKNVTVDGTLNRSDNNAYVAMIAQQHDGTGSLTVSNVTVKGSITGVGHHTAGLVAVLTLNNGASASFENINVSATINDLRDSSAGAPSHGCVSAGGVVGVFEPMGKANLTLKNVNVSGNITAKTKSVGGVIGQ